MDVFKREQKTINRMRCVHKMGKKVGDEGRTGSSQPLDRLISRRPQSGTNLLLAAKLQLATLHGHSSLTHQIQNFCPVNL